MHRSLKSQPTQSGNCLETLGLWEKPSDALRGLEEWATTRLMVDSTPVAAPAADLRRQLSWLDAAAIFVGIILGSGIFVAPAGVAAAVASPGWAAALWLAGACVAACGAFCYAECGARLPKTGGFYIFYREVYGAPVAFVAGWAALLVTYPASLAAISLIFARYLGQIIPGIADTNVGAALVGALALLLSALFNILGVKIGARIQKVLTAFKVLALVALCVAAVVAPATPIETAVAPADLLPQGFLGIVSAMVILLWTYDGWSDVTLVAGELKNPSKDLGRAVVVGVVVLAATYTVVQFATMTLLGSSGAAASKQVIADAVTAGLGVGMGRVVALLVVVSTFSSVNGIVLAASRLAFAMSPRLLLLVRYSSSPLWHTRALDPGARHRIVGLRLRVGAQRWRLLAARDFLLVQRLDLLRGHRRGARAVAPSQGWRAPGLARPARLDSACRLTSDRGKRHHGPLGAEPA